MLVLSRKPGERILIGDKIQITVVRIGPNTVRLGIDAPREINIVRDDIASPQHDGPLEADGGPASPTVLGGKIQGDVL